VVLFPQFTAFDSLIVSILVHRQRRLKAKMTRLRAVTCTTVSTFDLNSQDILKYFAQIHRYSWWANQPILWLQGLVY
jgi:hypothetical protein